MLKFNKNGKRVMEMKDDGKVTIFNEKLKKEMEHLEDIQTEEESEEKDEEDKTKED